MLLLAGDSRDGCCGGGDGGCSGSGLRFLTGAVVIAAGADPASPAACGACVTPVVRKSFPRHIMQHAPPSPAPAKPTTTKPIPAALTLPYRFKTTYIRHRQVLSLTTYVLVSDTPASILAMFLNSQSSPHQCRQPASTRSRTWPRLGRRWWGSCRKSPASKTPARPCRRLPPPLQRTGFRYNKKRTHARTQRAH